MTAPFNPIVMQQPLPQPVLVPGPVPMAGGGHMVSQPVMVQGAPQMVAGNIPPHMHPDPVLGIGKTASEVTAEQREFAEKSHMFEPQDFKPSDDDPSRYYMVRELDGHWTQRNRFTIDHLGCRWYLADEGYFYAVRLPD
jgi:hypothetical protein